MFPHRTLKRNILTLFFVFPITGFLLFLFANPFSTVYTPIHATHKLVHSLPHDAKTENRTFQIHVWNHGKRMQRRFLRSYGQKQRNPYEYCSVNNCVLTIDDSQVGTADAVMFHLHQTRGPNELPRDHPPHQMWIFFTDESPLNTFYLTKKYSMKDYNGLFNWSMTYRRDSDIPMPYGRTVPLNPAEKSRVGKLPNFAARKNLTVAVLGSNCGGVNHRWKYVAELQKHIKVDVYGGCGDLKCPGHFTKDCILINKYKFYLAFENSNCKEYITEKLWWNSFEKETVPIVMGPPKKDYQELCPPHSFIHVADYPSPVQLAAYIRYLNGNDTAYNEYLNWKSNYKVLNEHGYFGSPSLHLCRICEKLNSKSNLPKTYNKLASYWNPKKDCIKPFWKP